MRALVVALRVLADDPVALDWRGPEACPGPAAVLGSLEALAQRDEHAAARPRVRVVGVTREVGGRFELDLRIHTASMSLRRRLRADACETLADAAALLIAIALDPLEVAAQVAVEAADPVSRLPVDDVPLAVAAPPEAVVVAPPRPRPAAVVRPPASPRIVGLVRVEGGIDVGATPGLAGAVGGAAGLLARRVRVEAYGLYTRPRPLQLDEQKVGEVARWALGARGCARVVQGALEIPLCGALEGGQFLASGTGATLRPQSARPRWFAAAIGLGLMWSPRPRVGVGGRVELVVPLARARFAVDDRVAHTVQAAGVRVGLGLEIRLGPGARRWR